ncbi:OsmC family protein [Demequina salsinemoris]|uniref:OsmC family protein n=1 Tax=Demequina salsinemoris TaxID=577470 RepID=UPI0007804F38|nr:OsmC family protein [Demequina salsinemoris]
MTDARTPLHLERTGSRSYVARNERGAEVRLGVPGEEGTFSPGEMLQMALAACASMSMDHTLSRRLGEDFDAFVDIAGDYDGDENRFTSLSATLRTDLSALEPEKVESLIQVAERAVDRLCTIGRTVDNGAARVTTVRPS